MTEDEDLKYNIVIDKQSDYVFFEVFATHVDILDEHFYEEEVIDNYDMTAAGANDDILLYFDNFIDARECARQLVNGCSKYNFAEVIINWGAGDSEYARQQVAYVKAATADEINELAVKEAKNNGNYKLAENGLFYVWNDFGNARSSGLGDQIESILDKHSYDQFMKYYYQYKDGNHIYLPQTATYINEATDEVEEYDITIRENFNKILEHEYEWG